MEKERYHHQMKGDDEVIERVYKRPRNDKYNGNSNNQNGIENEYNYRGINNIPNQPQSRKEVHQPTKNSLVVSNHTQLLAGYTANNALDTDEKKKVQFTSLKSKSSGAIYKSLKNVANRNKSIECYNQQSAPSQVVVKDKVFPGTNIKKKSLSSLLIKVHNNTLSQQYDAKGATKYHFESSSELSYSSDSLDDNDFDSDDEEEELDDLLVELERVKQHYSEENAALKADVVTKESRIRELEELVARGNSSNATNGSSSSGREHGLKAVKDICQKYYDDHGLEEYHAKNGNYGYHAEKIRQLIQKEHEHLKPSHRFATKLMDDDQLRPYIRSLTRLHQKTSKQRRLDKLAEKKAILDKIIVDLERNAQFLNPNQAAYVIQCIFDFARLHPDTAEATSKMLSAILVQIQEFGDVGLEFLNSWGVTPLTEKFIEEFKANKDNWPYLQGGYYVGLTSVVEYMNVQTDGTKNTIGAFETVRGIAVSLGLSAAQVRNLGAISDSLFICLCRRSASIIESSLQTFFRGMYILAPTSKPHSRQVCVVSLQKLHDAGASSETVGDGDCTRANGVFITCIPGHSATNVRNTYGKFKVIDSFIPQTPVPTIPNAKVPQGFGRGGTK